MLRWKVIASECKVYLIRCQWRKYRVELLGWTLKTTSRGLLKINSRVSSLWSTSGLAAASTASTCWQRWTDWRSCTKTFLRWPSLAVTLQSLKTKKTCTCWGRQWLGTRFDMLSSMTISSSFGAPKVSIAGQRSWSLALTQSRFSRWQVKTAKKMFKLS